VTQKEIMGIVQSILDSVRAAVLTTVDRNGWPRARWMIPTILPGHEGALYAVTSPHFSKVHDLSVHPEAEWMVQTIALNQIVNLRGRINILDTPSLKARVMEQIGNHLHAYWKLSGDATDYLLLETVITEATLYLPMKGTKETVRFEPVSRSAADS